MCRISFSFAVLSGMLILSAMPAHAGLILTGSLTGANPIDGSGFGTVSIDNSFDMSVNISFSGLPGAANSASFAGFSLLLPFPSDTSGSASGVFVIDSGTETSLAGGSGTFIVSFTGGDGQISGQARAPFIPPPEADLASAPPPPQAFLPPPVPEPATFGIALLGLGVLAVRFRFRSRVRH